MKDIANNNSIGIMHNPSADYASPPFSPDRLFPEYPFKGELNPSTNSVYIMIRNLFHSYGLDTSHFNTKEWNPLGDIVKPGDSVLIKPNLVYHEHQLGFDIRSLFTNGSVIRAVADYVIIALKGKGRIIIGDAPLQSCDFEKLKQITGLNEIKDFYSHQGIEISLVDFRLLKAYNTSHVLLQEKAAGDSAGYTPVNLQGESLLEPISEHFEKFRVTCYNPYEMRQHHRKNHHEYIIPNTVLQADVVINLPKMKTHKKGGITGGLKNLVGINGHKDWLPHHRIGKKTLAGDEYLHTSLFKALHSWLIDRKEASSTVTKAILSPAQRILYHLARITSTDPYFEGSWWGNDTIWRTVLDLNRILLYASKNGTLSSNPQRKVFTIVDGIIAGEKEGPLNPTPRRCGVLLCGSNPAAIDAVIARLMGFDWKKIPQIANAFGIKKYPLSNFSISEIELILPDSSQSSIDSLPELYSFNFAPPAGWKNHIEAENRLNEE